MVNPSKNSVMGPISRAPLYQQLKALVLTDIRERNLKGGDRLETEPQMAARFGVSIGTVRRAMGALEDDGVVERKEGVGTFVRSFRHAGFQNSFHLFTDLAGQPRKSHPCRGVFLWAKPAVAPDFVAEALQLPYKSVVIHLARKLYGSPEGVERFITVDESYLRADVFKGLDDDFFRTHFRQDDSLYKFYDREFGVVINRQRCKVSFERIGAETAERLHLMEGVDMLKTERLSYSIGRMPVEYRINRGMADCTRVNFEVQG